VINDDTVQPNRGFGKHPHSNMEIITYIVNGFLTHQDSLKSSETLGPNSIQYMTAGTGIRHSEHNLHDS
jgi:quercetin 2,3-dioxygenase